MKDIIEPAYEIYVRGYTNAARNLMNMEGRVSGSTKLQSRYAKQGGEFSDALTGAEWTKYNHAMSTNADAGLRISDNSILVECEEDSDYQYKYVVYDNTFEDNPIKSVYAIGNIDYNVTNANKLAQFIYEMESRGYGQKVLDKGLRRYAKDYQIILGKYNGKSHRYNQYRTKVNQSRRNTQIQSDRTGFSGGAKQTGSIRYQERSQGYDFSDFGFDLIEDDGSIENSFAREYSKHSEDIGEVLKSIAAIDIAPSKVESIIRRVVRNSLGGIGTLAFDTIVSHFACIMI